MRNFKKSKLLFIILLLFTTVFQPLSTSAKGDSKEAINNPITTVDLPKSILIDQQFDINVTYQNVPSYSGNKGLVATLLIDNIELNHYTFGNLKPNDQVEFNFTAKISQPGNHKVKVKVLWPKPSSENRRHVSESEEYIIKVLNPMSDSDSDGDLLIDKAEKNFGTDPYNPDTDNDGLSDGIEVLSLDTDPTKQDTDENGILDGEEDFDSDLLTNSQEINLGTDPTNPDTDNDGLTDYEEVNIYKTNPLMPDTDNDGLLDGSEIKMGFNPLSADSDNNGINDGEENISQDISPKKLTHLFEENEAIPNLTILGHGDINNDITITDESDNPLLKDIRGIIGKPIDISLDTDFKEATLSFTISDETLENTNIENLNIFWFDDESSKLIPLETMVDKDNNKISTTINHFSIYFVMDVTKLLYDWVMLNQASNIEKGQADIVFVIDSTGSMSSYISNVKNNIIDFVNKLDNNKVDVRLGLVEYKDITADGINSTKSIGWFTTPEDFKAAISKIYASGGGDAAESAVDALEEARRSGFRSNVSKFIVLLTDVYYKEETRFPDVNSMEDAVNNLKNDGIITSVIAPARYQAFYDDVYRLTDGIFADINTNFSISLEKIIERISGATNDGF
ncbi:MAG TPA: VWA domain-containing protein [Bacillus bacterium]|nr:VWA domain-containing protein [Bacillus sp. (in: firmicutes)]